MRLLAKPRITAAVLLSVAALVSGFGMLTHPTLAADDKKDGAKEPTSTITVTDFILDTLDMERMTVNVSKEKKEGNVFQFKAVIIGPNAPMPAPGGILPIQVGKGPKAAKSRPMKMENLRVDRDARISIKGKPAKLSDLRVGMHVSVKLGIGKEQAIVQGKDIDLDRETILVREIQAQ